MVCSACGTPSTANAKFCAECGAALSARCSSCGTEYGPEQKFCAECGAALSGAAAAPPQAAAAAEPPGAELRQVSVLFVDLVGYTTIAEARDAEEARELLSRYFETAKTVIGRYGGTIEKFIGDAVMAVWGAPVAHENDAERAVRAGLELIDAVAAFGAEVAAPELRARAGVVTGQVAAIPTPGEALVVGDRVNTASRVQSVAEPASVFVDDVTRQVTASAIAYADAGVHTVKGKDEPLQLWRALRVVAGKAGSQRSEGLEAPFVGRDSELRLVKELYHACVDRGSARLVVVSGAAGVGKSRLLWEYEKYLDGLTADAFWHYGRCLSYGDGIAYWALSEMVCRRLGIADDASAEETARKLADGLERWVTDPQDRAFLEPRLGALLGIAEPGLGRDELFAGWRLFFERLAAQDPVVLAFEDVHWADAGLLAFIGHLVEWSAQYPIFIIVLARPELVEERAEWLAGRRNVTPIYLDPLDDDAVRALLDRLVEGLPVDARERIVAQAEGIPLYALETVRALADRGAVRRIDDRLVLDGELGELDVPASLSSLIAARLDALDPTERELVKAMAIFGGRFPRAAAAALSDVPEEQLDAVLASLTRKEILSVSTDPLDPDRGQYAFAQTLLRTVAYDMVPRRERKPRHIAAADHLRAALPAEGEDVAEVIASHYLDAYRAAKGDADEDELRLQALEALGRAGQRARVVGAPEVAERSYITAAELAGDEEERAALLAEAGRMAIVSGRLAEALALLDSAAEAHVTAGRARDAARIAFSIGQALWGLGRLEEAMRRMQEALDTLEPEGHDPDVAALSAEIARALVFSGRTTEAHPLVETALVHAEALGLPDVLCEALTTKGLIYDFTNRPEEARVLTEGAIVIAQRHGLGPQLDRPQINIAEMYVLWDLPEAAERLKTALAASRRIGDRVLENAAGGALIVLDVFNGRWEEAQRLGEELIGPPGASRPGDDQVHCRLAVLEALQGDVASARAHLEYLAAWEGAENLEHRGFFASTAGVIALGEGRLEEALERSGASARESVAHLGTGNEITRQAWPDAIEAALALGDLDEAASLLALVADLPTGLVSPYLRAQTLRNRARIDAARGRSDTVEADYAGAIATLDGLGHVYRRAEAQLDLARWLAEVGRTTEAAEPLGEVIATFERLGAVPALERAREFLAGAGLAAPGSLAAAD